MKLNAFNIDTQNSTATFFFVDPPSQEVAGAIPWVNINVKVNNVDDKTGSQIKIEATKNAIKMLRDVIAQISAVE